MVIWIDIGHPAQLNFYKQPIKTLSRDHEIIITVLERGKLPLIASVELNGIKNCKLFIIGKHRKTKFSVIYDANLKRFFQLLVFRLKNRSNLSMGNGFLHAMVSFIFKTPSIIFNDDIERKVNSKLSNWFANEVNYTIGTPTNMFRSKSRSFNALKEWSYLSPKYFLPDKNVLKDYAIKEFQYIFVREVSSGSLNYDNQEQGLIGSIAYNFPKDLKVILSLENKEDRDLYPEDWILLKEPIGDIYSLIYFSRLLVSSGDSMAREGSVLGVPSLYCGIRSMSANSVMIEKGKMRHVQALNLVSEIHELISNTTYPDRGGFRAQLEKEWPDVPELIKQRVKNYLG